MRLEADATPIVIAADECVHLAADPMRGDAAFVIAVTRSVSTRVQLARYMPADTILLLAPDRACAERALHAIAHRTDDGRTANNGRTADNDHAANDERSANDDVELASITCGGMVVDPQRQRVTWLGVPLRLTRLERRLLACLIEPPLRVWPYELLYRNVWRQDWLGDTSTVHAIIKRLRRRLRDAGVSVVLESIRGVGFSVVFQPAEIAFAQRPEVPVLIGPALPPPGHASSSAESASRAAARPSWKRVTTP